MEIDDKIVTNFDLLKKYVEEKGYGFVFITHLNKRYGSYIKYCEEIGFTPNFSSHNPKYSRQYFIDKAKNKEPAIRVFTDNEQRALYKYFRGGIKELKMEILK